MKNISKYKLPYLLTRRYVKNFEYRIVLFPTCHTCYICYKNFTEIRHYTCANDHGCYSVQRLACKLDPTSMPDWELDMIIPPRGRSSLFKRTHIRSTLYMIVLIFIASPSVHKSTAGTQPSKLTKKKLLIHLL